MDCQSTPRPDKFAAGLARAILRAMNRVRRLAISWIAAFACAACSGTCTDSGAKPTGSAAASSETPPTGPIEPGDPAKGMWNKATDTRRVALIRCGHPEAASLASGLKRRRVRTTSKLSQNSIAVVVEPAAGQWICVFQVSELKDDPESPALGVSGLELAWSDELKSDPAAHPTESTPALWFVAPKSWAERVAKLAKQARDGTPPCDQLHELKPSYDDAKADVKALTDALLANRRPPSELSTRNRTLRQDLATLREKCREG